MEDLKRYIREIPDWPKPGISFKDITTLLINPQKFKETIDELARRYAEKKIDKVLSVEARGFIFGGCLAYNLNAGFVPIRKKGKLPYKTYSAAYQLEYGTDTLEIHQDAISRGDRVLIFDDVLATGGTIEAVTGLIKKLGGEIVEIAFLSELTYLNGREKLKDYPVFSLVKY